MAKRSPPRTPDNWRRRIVCDPKIHHGEACIRGTRVSVAVIVGSLADLSKEEVLKHFPQVSLADVEAAIFYAADAAHNTMVA